MFGQIMLEIKFYNEDFKKYLSYICFLSKLLLSIGVYRLKLLNVGMLLANIHLETNCLNILYEFEHYMFWLG